MTMLYRSSYFRADGTRTMRICIIGAGASGLCSARHFTAPESKHFQVQVLEKCPELGGTWVYSPRADLTSYSHGSSRTSIYKNLLTNLPKEVMAFPDYPFPSHLPSFCGHTDVLQYLQSYAVHFELHQYIKFNCYVENIRPISLTRAHPTRVAETSGCNKFMDTVKWEVVYRNLCSGSETVEDYDAVVVCKGLFSLPYIPYIPGLMSFLGSVSHSHFYREPDNYKSQDVVIVGAGNSGRDLVLDLSGVCNKVYICNRGTKFKSTLPSNAFEVPSIMKVKRNGHVRFSNGQEVRVDRILLATGFTISFPFLPEESGIEVVGRQRVTPLFKHTFNSLYPSMAFIGVSFNFLPFLLFDYQSRWVKSVLSGQCRLPSTEEMIKDEEETYQMRLAEGMSPEKAGHYLADHQWELFDYLSEAFDGLPPHPAVRSLFDHVIAQRQQDLMHYRKQNFIIDEKRWRLI